MDTSKVSLTYIKLKSEKFEKYYCDKPIIIGIDTCILFKVIKYCNRRETITFYMTDTEPDKLGIELSDPFMGKIKDYKIPLLLNFKDGNKNNFLLDNLELLCYNDYFLFFLFLSNSSSLEILSVRVFFKFLDIFLSFSNLIFCCTLF